MVVVRATCDPCDHDLGAVAKACRPVLVSSDHDVLEAEISDLDVLTACEFLERLD